MISDEQLDILLSKADAYVNKVSTAFLNAMDRYSDDVDYDLFLAALTVGDAALTEEIINTSKLDPFLYGVGIGAAASFVEALQQVFVSGAKTAVIEVLELTKKEMAFDILGERAVDALRWQVSEAIKDAVSTTAEGVSQLLATKAGIYDNIARQAQETIKLIGLTPSQVVAVSNYRKQLEERHIFDLTHPLERRIDVLDRLLVRHQMTVGGLSQAQIDALVERYALSLKEQRALTIARTETMRVFNAGRQEAWEQAADQGIIDIDEVRKFWKVTPDDRLREIHAAIPIMNPHGVELRSMFATPFGSVYGPQDRRIELINCRCVVVLDFVAI